MAGSFHSALRGRGLPALAQAVPTWVGPGFVLILAMMLGGGTRQGYWSDAVVQLASLPLLAVSLWRIALQGITREAGAGLLVAGGAASLPLLQLIPLPPSIWASLPGHAFAAEGYQAAGIPPPWLGISLSPEVTWRALATLLPALALFTAVLLLGYRSRRILALGLIVWGLLSVLVGLAQLAQGSESGLRFYQGTNVTEAVGFFANRNHFAALLYCLIPITAAWAICLAADRRWSALTATALCLLVLVSLILGIGMARSRAGIVLAMAAILGSVLLALRQPSSRRPEQGSAQRPDVQQGRSARGQRYLYAGIIVGVAFVFQFASIGILQRVEADIADDARWQIADVTFAAARAVQPFGSGFGTFEWLYRMHEGVEHLTLRYTNHAHNDYLQLLLEGGWPAIALIVVFFAWLVVQSVRVWRSPAAALRGNTLDVLLPRAAVLGVWLLCLHSAVDYPLRTTTLSALFAVLCAMAVAPSGPPSRTRPRPHRDRAKRARTSAA